MSLLVENCPRCGAERMTFDVWSALPTLIEFRWKRWFELFCVCRNCLRSTTFVVYPARVEDEEIFAKTGALLQEGLSLNNCATVDHYLALGNMVGHTPPEHIPPEIESAFKEGARCFAVQCWNAAATMFRMCVDLATRPMLPQEPVEGLNARTRRDLGLRLQWLFDNGRLPADLRSLSTCIREDGNDGAHAGTLTKEDAEDLLDFTYELLERLYTEPERLEHFLVALNQQL